MSTPPPTAPDGAFDYIVNQLADGMSLPQAAAARLRAGHAGTLAIVPAGVRDQQLAAPETGLGASRGTTCAQLAGELTSRFPNSRLIVALPLAKPDDSSLASIPGTVATCAGQVYLAVDLQAEVAVVEQALRAQDPSFSYALVVVDHAAVQPHVCPTDALESGEYTLRAAGVGAYDGEGFLVAVV